MIAIDHGGGKRRSAIKLPTLELILARLVRGGSQFL
jgi:hypothetical protein